MPMKSVPMKSALLSFVSFLLFSTSPIIPQDDAGSSEVNQHYCDPCNHSFTVDVPVGYRKVLEVQLECREEKDFVGDCSWHCEPTQNHRFLSEALSDGDCP